MTHVGARIATERRLAGLNQTQLAARMNYSLSMLRAVEQGREPASPGFTAAVAAALHVEPEQLTGAPYYQQIESNGGPLEGLPELRVLLAEGGDVDALEPGTLREMRAELDTIDVAHRRDKGRAALLRLHVTIRQLHGALHAARDDQERGRIYTLLAHAYMDAGKTCHRFQFLTLATAAYDRMDWAAVDADDPVYAAIGKSLRARILMQYDATDKALRLIEDDLNAGVGESGAAISAARGHAHLCGAIVAARGRRLDTAREHLAEARSLARFADDESDLYGLMFGPANVEIHSCSVELEAGDPAEAAREGSVLVLPKTIAESRAGHHWQDVARAWLMSGQPDKSLKALMMARKVAPQMTRVRPTVRETLYGIAAAERKRSDSLGNFARWVGISL